jgi:hypothetical protein
VLLDAVLTVLPFAVTAALCLWLYRFFAVRVSRGTFSALDATFVFCLVSLFVIPTFIGATTLYVLYYLYMNFPQTRPQSWDVAIGYSARAYWLCSLAMAVVACMVAGWKLFHCKHESAT